MSRLSRPAASRRISIGTAILERPVIEKILTRLGLLAQPPPKARALQSAPMHAA